MKSFFASFFGTLAAFAMLFLSLAVLGAVFVSGVTAKREPQVSVPSGAYLVLDLADEFQDAPLSDDGLEDLASLFDGDARRHVLQARRVVRALAAAASDSAIDGLYLSGQGLSPGRSTGFATLKEVRDAIVAFRASGKPVKAWLNFGGTREYYLASAADEVVLDPFGALLVPGLATQPVFYAGTFEKLGIGVQVTRVGKYKSAVEPYTRRDMSPESRTQTQKLIDDLWTDVSTSMESARKLDAGGILRVADSEGLIRAEAAVNAHLVDRAAYVDEMLDELRKATDVKGAREPFKQIAMADYAKLVPVNNLEARRQSASATSSSQKVAIVYAEGAIVDGTGTDDGVVWGDKLSRDLREIRHDDAIRAVVLRVNSPGGSVTASEAIQREVRLIQKSKPVVVSMGTVAASGGYWISTYSDRIFAEPTTITGSIGVFGLLFNVQGLATDKLGLTFETVKRGRFSDAATITRPKTPEELEVLQKSVDWVYDQFVSKVAESRKLDPAAVREIAQGRVWSGAEAATLGLVDEIGGLEKALAFAAGKASVGEEFTVVEYPVRKALVEQMAEALSRKRQQKADAGTFSGWVQQAIAGAAALAEYNDPRGIYARLPFDLALH